MTPTLWTRIRNVWRWLRFKLMPSVSRYECITDHAGLDHYRKVGDPDQPGEFG